MIDTDMPVLDNSTQRTEQPYATARPSTLTPKMSVQDDASLGFGATTKLTVVATAALLVACGSNDDPIDGAVPASSLAGSGGPAPAAKATTTRDAARLMAQATFGATSPEAITQMQAQGTELWLHEQFNEGFDSHLVYLENQRNRDAVLKGPAAKAREEMSYEAVWQQWLWHPGQLRARVSWALLQIFVISNVAPDIRPHAMSSYMDMLNRNAFGNWRTLLEDVTLHPAMGYYLNMLGSEKSIPAKDTHPNENYAREVLQLFSIGLAQLNPDGTPQLDAAGKPQPTYTEAVVKGYARAFSGWSYGGLDNSNANSFHHHDDNIESLWTVPMKAWDAYHEPGDKTLLNGRTLAAGQSAQQDMKDALDSIFQHPNVPPFFCRQMIQRLVTSNPTPGYVQRVANVFIDNGAGVRGDLRAVVQAVLMDNEARGDAPSANVAKQREPVIRFAHYLRALNAKSGTGRNSIHHLDSADDALGQSPLLAPSVFNFYSPSFKPAGPIAAAGMVAPEFQITSETTMAGSMNFFSSIVQSGGYGWDDSRLKFDYEPWLAMLSQPEALVDRIDLMFFARGMSATTRDRMLRTVKAMDGGWPPARLHALLVLTALAPDFVIQR
jgi:uncharacterized protein (DUF1800 family)